MSALVWIALAGLGTLASLVSLLFVLFGHTRGQRHQKSPETHLTILVRYSDGRELSLGSIPAPKSEGEILARQEQVRRLLSEGGVADKD